MFSLRITPFIKIKIKSVRLKSLIISGAAILLTAQMPGWKPFIDRDGNRYFLDTNGKIMVSIDDSRGFSPVSARGIEFSLKLADEFIRAHRKSDALVIWKSILRLKPDSSKVIDAQKISTKKITALMKTEAERYEFINDEASALFVAGNNSVLFSDDIMRYSMSFGGTAFPVRKSLRRIQNYEYRGITIGVRNDNSSSAREGSYDYLAAVDAEKFKVNTSGIDSFEEYRQSLEGATILSRKIINSSGNMKIYEFTSTRTPEYSGYELLCTSGRYGIVVRLITPAGRFAANKVSMRAAVESFRHVAE